MIATARDIDALKDLVENYGESILPLQLDVSNRSKCFEVVNKAYEHFGRLDVVINNAGFSLFGAVEEVNEVDARKQFDTNLFGTLWVSQAAIPIMRQQGKGHIVQISSVLGHTSFPAVGLYNATKWAVEGLSESMATEIQKFGIATTIVEPATYATGASAVQSVPLQEYDWLRQSMNEQFSTMTFANPEASAKVILKVVDAENPPLRIFLGKDAYPMVNQVYSKRLSAWEEWNKVSEEAQ